MPGRTAPSRVTGAQVPLGGQEGCENGACGFTRGCASVPCWRDSRTGLRLGGWGRAESAGSCQLRPLCTPQVSFQHEVYPAEPGPVAPGRELEEQPLSRQVFIVQELEVRDRLASSQINKFLYLHTSERMPRRTHSNMVWAPPRATHVHARACRHTHTQNCESNRVGGPTGGLH